MFGSPTRWEAYWFESRIEYICKKAFAGIGALWRIKPFVLLCTLVTLCNHSWTLFWLLLTHVVSNWEINYKKFKIEREGLLQALHMMLGLYGSANNPRTVNDPGPQMIPKLDRKWSRTANDPRWGPQMIPTKKLGMAWMWEWREQGIGMNNNYFY